MNIKQRIRWQLGKILASRGYALTRTSITGTGWKAVLDKSLNPQQDAQPVVLDIGANYGGFSEMVLTHCAKAKIYAFEPLPAMSQRLESLAKVHPNIHIVPVALGAEVGTAFFNVHTDADSSSVLDVRSDYRALYSNHSTIAERIQVRMEKLDDYWIAQNGPLESCTVDLVKIDVQGFEGSVIAGGEKLLCRTRYLAVEAALYPAYEGGIMLDELSEQLRQLNFELIWAFNVVAASCDLFWRNKALVAE